MIIPPEHLLIEVEKDNSHGGQTCGALPRGITITHLPTNLKAFCNCERSQMKNKKIAMLMIEYACAELNLY